MDFTGVLRMGFFLKKSLRKIGPEESIEEFPGKSEQFLDNLN